MAKIISGGLILLIALGVVVTGYLTSSDIHVSKTISVDAPIDYVFEEINTTTNWPRWSYWHAHETSTEVDFTERISGQGMSAGWKSGADSGRLIVLKSVYPDTIAAIVYRNNENSGKAWAYLKASNDNVSLTMGVELSFEDTFIERYKTLLFRRRKAKEIVDYHLTRLKELAENKPVFSVPISTASLAPSYYAYISAVADTDNPESVIDVQLEMHERLSGIVKESMVVNDAHPLSVVNRNSGATTTIAYGIPIHADAALPAHLIRQLYSGLAVRAIHYGDIATISDTYDEIRRYMEYKHYISNGEPWEVYRSGPADTTERETWITEVYYPVEEIIF